MYTKEEAIEEAKKLSEQTGKAIFIITNDEGTHEVLTEQEYQCGGAKTSQRFVAQIHPAPPPRE